MSYIRFLPNIFIYKMNARIFGVAAYGTLLFLIAGVVALQKRHDVGEWKLKSILQVCVQE